MTTVVLDARRDADDPRAVEAVGNAEMIFFAGGDQSRYVDWIHRTGFERALYAAIFQRSVPVGGTSAGMAFLAGIDYTGRFSSPSSPGGWVSSEDVLADPSGAFVDLNPLVLVGPLLRGVITETHLSERDRYGRVVGFMANAWARQIVPSSRIRAIAADEGTAACYDAAGDTWVFGAGEVVFLSGSAPVERFAPGEPLTWIGRRDAVSAARVRKNPHAPGFQLESWVPGDGARIEHWWVDQGILHRE